MGTFASSLRRCLFSGIFACFYHLYRSRVGLAFHQRLIRGVTAMHSQVKHVKVSDTLTVVLVPVLSDNYAFIGVDGETKQAFVVDPADANVVMQVVNDLKVAVTHCLTTHSHWDHAGGNASLAAMVKDLRVLGSSTDGVPSLTHPVKEGDEIQFGKYKISIMDTPCHTRGHVLYLVSQGDRPLCIFTGDTIFLGGTGRFFEGSASQMLKNITRVSALPPQTLVFSGHEYAVNNLRFALAVDPTNECLKEKMQWCSQQREAGVPTVPSTVGEEREYNPFFRVTCPAIVAVTGHSDGVESLAQLRWMKDNNVLPPQRDTTLDPSRL